jgi:two-component system, cell cycle sensor histidine kinase and response regulator CckA
METDDRAPRKCRVLIVDDNVELAQYFKHLLEAHDYDVSVVADSLLALKHILHQQVDAVVCDLKMPQLAGDMFYATIDGVNPDLRHRFVFITGEAEDPEFQTFVGKVEAPVLRKPVPIAQLLLALERVLEKES